MLCVCVFCTASSSSSINSPTSGGSGGIGPGISKPLETPIENKKKKEKKKSRVRHQPATNYFMLKVFLSFIYISTQCVFYCLVSLYLSPGGVFCSSSVQWTTQGEHGWQEQQKAPPTNGRIGGR